MTPCKECMYFEQFSTGLTNLGYCKFDAPVILQQPNKTGYATKNGQWPIVRIEDHGCGQGQPLKETI